MALRPKFEHAAMPHMDAALTLAHWLMRNRADAEDVVQDAYVRAFRAYDTMTGEHMRPWLLAIVRNVAYRALSRRQRGANVISLEEAFPGPGGRTALENALASADETPEEALLGHGERALVSRALGELPPIFREALVLREIEDLSYREIADITGVPIGTVMSRLSRARAELKRIFAQLIDKDDRNAV